MFRALVADLRFGLRMMLRSPGFTLVALLTMVLGIGANTAMFSIVNGVIIKPLQYPEADRIVRLFENNASEGWETFSIAPMNLWDWQERNRSLELLGAYRSLTVNSTGGERPESLRAYHVTGDYLEILGAEAIRGRGITDEDLQPDRNPVVVLTHGFWLRGFGADPDIIGQQMVLDGVPHDIVGVLAAGWRPPARTSPDLILPLRPEPWWTEIRGAHFLQALGRLWPGVTLEQARQDFSSIAANLAAEYPDVNDGWGVTVWPLSDLLLGSSRAQLLILMASVGLVLVIACANLANMLLARATTRTRELAIRTALGAGRGRVARQLLAESTLLAAVGGATGVFLAYLALRIFVAEWPTMLPRMQEIEVDSTVLLFSLGLALASGLVFGLAPALSVTGKSPAGVMRQDGRGVAGSRSRRWMRSGLVVAEVGLAVVLLVGMGLLVRSFSTLQSENPGFVAEDRLVFATPLPESKYGEPEAQLAFTDAALARIGSIPGVESAALTNLVPLEGSDNISGFWLEGRPSTADVDGYALYYRVSPGYFKTMGIPLLAGRDITSEDHEGTREVVVVSRSLAERQFPGQEAVGRRFRWGRSEDGTYVEIVGVVGDVQHYTLGEESIPQVYTPFTQSPDDEIYWVVKTAIPPLRLVDGTREAIAAVDPEQPLVGIQTAEAMIADSISTPLFRTLLMSGFGLTALLLAVVGLYGVMAYSVTQRSREIGVRVALGATRGSILGMVFCEGLPLVGAGLLLGLGAALALSRILESMLFGVGARDPGVFIAVPLLLLVVAATAIAVPARRAARLDPVKALGGA
jgi:putative ABC transport system permease protein